MGQCRVIMSDGGPMIYKGLTVTGTDTGIGKTAVACALSRLSREAGFKVGVLKPVETGCKDLPEDGLKLAASAGLTSMEKSADRGVFSGDYEWDDIVPWRFAAPLAPEEAARLEGIEISVDSVYQAANRWMVRADLIVSETAGGVMVPINSRFLTIDLIKALELPLILVAADRLGVINHTLLTVEALYRRGLEVLAIVLVRLSETADLSSASNADVISRHTGVPLVQVPYEVEKEGAPVREVFADAGERAAFNALKPFFPVIMEGVEKRYNIVKRLYISGGKKKTDQD